MLRLKDLREERKLNMRQAAKALEIPYTTYISYEKGERKPNSEMLINLADFFNCSIDYLIGRSNERIDESVLDRVNSIEPDILEACDGNLNTAEKWQEERDDLTSRLEAAHEIYKQAQKKQPTEKQAAAIDKIKNMSPDELQQAEVFLDFIISKREDSVDE